MTRSLTREKTMARTTKTVPADGDRTLVESSPDPEARPSLKAGLGSERIWRMLVETAADGFWLLDAQFRTVFVNPAIEQMLGFTSEEMVGRAWDSFGDAEWMARAKALEERRVSGVKEPHEFLFIRKDGSKVLTRIATTPLYDDKGEFDGALGIVSDITEQKKTGEASLRMSEERYRLLFDRATDGILVLTTEGRIVAANESFARMHGYTAHEMRSMNLKDLDTPASSQRVGERVRRLLAGESLTFEVEHQKKDGQVFPLEVSASLITSSGGDALIQAFHRDITERREAERALRLMRTSVDTASDALFWMVPDGRIVQVNDAACRSLGYTRDELLALCVPDVDAHYTADLWRTHFPALAAAGSLTFESEQRAKDGRLIPVEIVANYVRIGEEEFNCAFVRDITERKQASAELTRLQAQLQQAQKMETVGRLAGGVAHDYNNMLAVIIGHTELSLLRTDVPVDLRDDLAEVLKAATHSAEITQQLLTFARKQVIQPQLLDLNATVAHSLKMLRPLIGEQVSFTWHPAADLWPVTMDATQVDQILTNLCLNARDAITGVGTVVVTTANRVADAALCETLTDAVPGDYVQLTVTDSGRGMSRAVLARVFEPFYTTKGVGEGSGLGLASVYGAVRQNGGFVGVASVEGEGTTFDIYLPRREGTLATPVTPEPAAPMPKRHETILVVEDEPAVRRMTVRALEGQGYTVLAADGPREAIRLAQERGGGVALLLTDVQMPEMSGHDLAATLRSAQPHVKHLFMSGFPMPPSADDGQMEDAAHFLAKPFTLSALTAKVREVLDSV